MRLESLINAISPVEVTGGTDGEFQGLNHDSRKVGSGDVFFALSGLTVDGNQFIAQAIENGAVAVVSEKPADVSVPVALVKNARLALSKAANFYYDYPARNFSMLGVTGTNGKTTISYLIKAILEKAEKNVGLIGSITNYIGSEEIPANYTTPDALELFALLAKMAEKDVETVVMEVSSHALALDRIVGCQFATAIFTNLTHDHLDFHKNFENYKITKAKLFAQYLNSDGKKIINIDDEFEIGRASCRERV